jgi:hypothetical protein
MTRAELQRALGRSRSAVDLLLAQGLPHETIGSGHGATIRIPRDAALAWLADRGERGRPRSAREPAKPPKIPDHLRPALDLPSPFERGFATLHLWSVHHAAPLAAWAVVEAGGNLDLAHKAATLMPMMVMIEQGKFGKACGLEPWRSTEDPDLYVPEAFQAVDWERLRAQAGEPDWRPPKPPPDPHDVTCVQLEP